MQARKIIRIIIIHIADDKTSVVSDDIGEYQYIFLLRTEHRTDIFYRDSRDQRHGYPTVFHRIIRVHAKQDHFIAGLILSHRNFLFMVFQRSIERFRIGKFDLFSVQHFQHALFRTKRKIIKISDPCPVNQFLIQILLLRRNNLHYRLDLLQLQIDQCPKMSRDPFIDALHIQIPDLADGILTHSAHIISQTTERPYTDQQQENKTSHQKVCCTTHSFCILTFHAYSFLYLRVTSL